ncbi:MAG: hypothetical protein M3128_04055 [Verrucomicrobiota bacterium]|nr:hypothetical protein [Verrucomicrobiota bacterium]
MRTVKTILLAVCFAGSASAQFIPALLQNDSYWADGKAEFNIYAAEIMRGGIARPCEVIHILVREPLDSIPVLKLNQILNVPMGLTTQQQMHSNYWRVDNSALMKFCLTSSDGAGNVYKEMRRKEDQLTYEFRGVVVATENITLPAKGYFYDELPWLVRTIDFSKPSVPFEIQVAPSVIKSQQDKFEFKSAKITFSTTAKTIEVRVGEDRFTLDREGPNLLREWKAADGSHLKMKRNLKVDYLKYDKPGDRERALNDPMLRLPD